MSTTCSSILNILSISSAIAAVLAPFPDFWRIYKTRSTGTVSVLPAILIFCNCYAWVCYARVVNSVPPLFVAYAVGMLASITFAGIYYHWTQDHARMHKLYGAAFKVLAAYTLYYTLGTSGVTSQSGDAVENTLGVLSGLINLALYASPLETMRDVIQTQDASTIPITTSVSFLANAVIWVLFSTAQGDTLVLIPNAIGIVLCVVQVALYVIYRPRTTNQSVIDTLSCDSATASACTTVSEARTVEYVSLKDGSCVVCV